MISYICLFLVAFANHVWIISAQIVFSILVSVSVHAMTLLVISNIQDSQYSKGSLNDADSFRFQDIAY